MFNVYGKGYAASKDGRVVVDFARVSECGRNGAKLSRYLEGQRWIFLQHCSKVGGEMETFEKKVGLQGNDCSRKGVEPKGV
jgi:hypothetical protein